MPIENDKNKNQPHYVDNQSIINKFNKLNKSLASIQNHAAILCRFLAPPKEIKKQGDIVSERLILDKANYLQANPPSLIFIFGNNDLPQVEFVAHQLTKWDERIPVIISGKGGHGTVLRPIPKYSEASTFQRKLEELGIRNPIIIDEYATNTGQNISNAEKLLKDFATQDKCPFSTIYISGSFSGAFRQLRSFAKQSTIIAWEKLFLLVPDEEKIIEKYFNTYLDATVNLYVALREILSLIDYMLNTDYVLIKSFIDKEVFRQAHAVTMQYLSELLHDSKITDNADKKANQLLDYIQLKETSRDLNEETILKNKLVEFYKPLVSYARISFDFLERESMKNLANKSTIQDLYSQSLFYSKTYDKIGVDPISSPNNVPKPK